MEKEQGGPLINDKEFFLQCISRRDERMQGALSYALEGDYKRARKEFADTINLQIL